jgi:hypothetical protein
MRMNMDNNTPQYPYPVTIEVAEMSRFARVQLLVRVLVVAAFGMVHESGPGLFSLLYFILPVVAAVLITQRTGAGYLDRDAPWLISFLEWVVGFYAYMLFVTDRFPLDARGRAVRLNVAVQGTPTVGRALLRLVTSLPQLVVLFVLGLVSLVVAVIAAAGILLFEGYPKPLRGFQRGVLGSIARLFSYHASLVQTYPPLGINDQTPAPPDEPVEPPTPAAEHA